MLSSSTQLFSDPAELQAAVRAAAIEIVIKERGAYSADLTKIDLHRLWMQRSRQSLPSITHSAVTKGRVVVLFAADTDGPALRHGGKVVGPGDVLQNSLGAEHYSASSAGYSWASMSLTPRDLAAAGRALVGRELMAPAATRLLHPPPEPLSRLRRLHKAAGDLAATAPEVLAHPEVAKALEQELVRALVECLAETDGDSTVHRGTTVMRRFWQVLEANEGEPLYMPELCAKIGVTGRTLRNYCQEHLGMSAVHYLWLRRMHLARRALAAAAPTAATVTGIANDYGFGELGRFAVTYRELFGESPSATLRQVRDVQEIQAAPVIPFLHSL